MKQANLYFYRCRITFPLENSDDGLLLINFFSYFVISYLSADSLYNPSLLCLYLSFSRSRSKLIISRGELLLMDRNVILRERLFRENDILFRGNE